MRIGDNSRERAILQAGGFYGDRCVCCGEQIPEGTMVCPRCRVNADKLTKAKIREGKKRDKTYTVTQSYLDRMVRAQVSELLEKSIKEFRDQELPLLREDVRKVLSLYQAIWRDVLGDMGLLTRDNAQEILTRTAERWGMIDKLIANRNMHELQKYASSLGADEDVFLDNIDDLLKRDKTPEQIAEIILGEEDE